MTDEYECPAEDCDYVGPAGTRDYYDAHIYVCRRCGHEIPEADPDRLTPESETENNMEDTSWGDLAKDRRSEVSNDPANNPWSGKNGFEGFCTVCLEEKENCHEHHTSYEPEKTRTVCASCHYRIHHESGYHDDIEPDFMRRRRKRRERRDSNNREFDLYLENDSRLEYHLVELPSDYLNDKKPQILESFDNREDAESEMRSKIYALDLHGSCFEIMVPGESTEVTVDIMGCEREMSLLICNNCREMELTDSEVKSVCSNCNG